MTCSVTFIRAKGVGSIHAPGIGGVRATEIVTVPNTTTAAAVDGETVIVFNGDTGAVMVAFGSTPDAAATVETSATSAGYVVPALQASDPFIVPAGAKINIKVRA